MAFVGVVTITPISMVFGCGATIDIFSCASILLEETVAFIRNIQDQWKMTWELLWRCEVIVLSVSSSMLVIPDIPSPMAHPILWHPPNNGITLVELFRVIKIGGLVRGWLHGSIICLCG